jgi:anaerobic magnesium-protoporphyrin IX monomethyl ester cyclase
MAKLIFIQDIAYEYMGVMHISSYLKQHGHDCDVIIESLEKQVIRKLEAARPDIIGFSTLSGSFKWALNLSADIKKAFPDIPIIFGGVHVYSNPASVIKFDSIDIICTGEGEIAMKELCDSIDRGRIDTAIEGLWFKHGGGIIKNPMSKLIDDLDSLPFPDRAIYWKYPSIESRNMLPILGSRGCPYTCAYCFIPKAKEIFDGLGKFVRQRSSENIIRELEQCVKQSPKKSVVHFVEDHFGNNRTRTLEVLQKLSSLEPKVKWAGAIRIERFVEEKYVAELSKTNHSILGLAVECGNEAYRNTVLSREVKNSDIIKSADLANKYGIRYVTMNMIGLPGETFEMAMETLDLNIRLKPEYANCYVYQPYAETKLKDYGVEHNYFTESVADELGFSFYDRYNKDDKELQKIINIQRIFGLVVAFPVLKDPLVWLTKKSWSKKILDGIFGLYYLYYLIKYFNISASQLIKYMQLWFQSQYIKKVDPVSDTIAQGKAQFYTHKAKPKVKPV